MRRTEALGSSAVAAINVDVLRPVGAIPPHLAGIFEEPPDVPKYDRQGTLLFERHIEGRELDDFVTALPTSWPTRSVEDREVPYVASTVRTAAVDTRGQLWVSLTMPYTYVYDPDGDKVLTVQFDSTGVISPTSLSFCLQRSRARSTWHSGGAALSRTISCLRPTLASA